jgi:hypothetical protein
MPTMNMVRSQESNPIHDNPKNKIKHFVLNVTQDVKDPSNENHKALNKNRRIH